MHQHACTAFLQVRKGEGLIINMSAVRPTPAQCVYSTCKWGLRGWSLSCQEALRHHGVKVMLINPGAVLFRCTLSSILPWCTPELESSSGLCP